MNNSLPLSNDIIDRILTFLPSFSTLQSAILTSKSFYEVFQARPKSTIRAVSFNVVGPALPQALRVLRYKPGPVYQDMTYYNPPQPELEDDHKAPITPGECVDLVRIEETVRGLEDLFSLRSTIFPPSRVALFFFELNVSFLYRHKNCRFTTSQLSTYESHRFCRATYRIMLYYNIFSLPLLRGFEWRIDSEEEYEMEVRKTETVRAKFLSRFSTEEVYEIRCVSMFLKEVVRVMERYLHQLEHSLEQYLALGPDIILEEYRLLTHYGRRAKSQLTGFADKDDIYGFCEGYLSSPIQSLLTERKVPSQDDREVWFSILDAIEGEHDT
ncbi:hypothetical protein K435DRAFT_879208, partial [Dendrothele bispora CBS 962.96]